MTEIARYEGGIALTGEYETDLDVGAKIRDAAESLQFMLGDWVLSMQERHGESVRSLAPDMSRVTGVPAKTLEDYASVSRAFPATERSVTASWSHHRAAVYGSDTPVAVLKEAEAKGLSVRDTARLAKGLPVGGEETAKRESSAAPTAGNLSLEEIVLSDLDTAREYLARAEATMGKQGFRLTVPVGQEIVARLKACAKPFQKIEAAVEDECGALL